MKNGENQENQGESSKNGSPCWPEESWAECCPDISNLECGCFNSKAMPQAMASCFSRCRIFLLVPVILGITFLALGYYLDSDLIRALWMIGAGMVVVMTLLAVLAMRRFAANGFSGCCGPRPKR